MPSHHSLGYGRRLRAKKRLAIPLLLVMAVTSIGAAFATGALGPSRTPGHAPASSALAPAGGSASPTSASPATTGASSRSSHPEHPARTTASAAARNTSRTTAPGGSESLSPSATAPAASLMPAALSPAAPAAAPSAPAVSAPAAGGPCGVKPSASTTGASGPRSNSAVTTLGNGQVLQNANVSDLVVAGNGVTVRNVQVNGSILVTGDGAMIDHVTAKGVSISSAAGTTVQYANIGFGQGDGIHITSDRGRLVRNVTLRDNFVHDPRVPSNAHYDGTQVRGINGLSISCSVYSPGAYQPMFNAAVYLEDANGGDSNVSVSHNWLYGFGFSVMMDAANVSLSSNRVGGDIHWGLCRLGTRTGDPNLVSTANVEDANGAAVKLCR